MIRWSTILALVISAALPAAAQPRRQAGGEEEDARRLFFEGAQLFQEGDFEAALASWRASYDMRPTPVVRYNIALALRELFRYAEAVEVLRQYLSEATSITEARRADVQAAVADLEQRIAAITLDIEPAGATVRIDGREVGAAPLIRPLRLSAGRRRLEVRAEGYVALDDDIAVVGGQARTLRIRLAPRDEAGTLAILQAMPALATIQIDGLDVGVAPVTRELFRGGHVIEANAPGHAPYRTSIEIADRQRLELRLTLQAARQWSIVEEWWFWTAIAAVVAAGTIAIVIAAQPQELPPVPGSGFQRVVEVLLER